MSKTLNTIQTISKVLKVISMIVFVASIVGAIICAIGSICIFAIKDISVGEMTITSLIEDAGTSFAEGVLAMITASISCIGAAILAKFAHTYFTHELEAGTPFTYDGAKELKRLGIMWIACPLIISLLSSVAFAVYQMFDSSLTSFTDYGVSVDLSVGILLIIMSIIFEHGAEREEIHNLEKSKEYEDVNEFNGFDQ